MKYLVILFATYNDGTADKKAIYELPTDSEVRASFHSYMGSYMVNPSVDHVMCMAINTEGGIYASESWTRDITNEESGMAEKVTE